MEGEADKKVLPSITSNSLISELEVVFPYILASYLNVIYLYIFLDELQSLLYLFSLYSYIKSSNPPQNPSDATTRPPRSL